MMFFLVLSLFEDKFHMSTFKGFKIFNIFYNAGLGHIALTIGLITMLLILNKASKKFDNQTQKI